VTQGDIVSFMIMGQRIEFVVSNYRPKADAVIITLKTKVSVSREPVSEDLKTRSKSRVSYEDIGGLDEEIKKIREMIELPLRHPEIFARIGVSPPKGVLLYGPPGTGKTLLARAVANETDAHFINLSGPEIMSKFYGASEENLRKIFKEAQDKAPSIIFIDEIDSIAPKREEVTGEVERRVVAQLLALMDGLESRGEVVVIGATNRPNSIDPALRRPGRFDREIEIGVPNKDGRYQILQIHTRGMPLAEDTDLEYCAERTHGFVGADLQALAKEAAMRALRRILPEINMDEPVPAETLEKIIITQSDLVDALQEIEPSALREVLFTTPTETWADIGGLYQAKQELQEAVEWPLKYPNTFKHMGAKAPSGILLYGPPGTGKTLLAKALAHETEVNFISVKGPEFLSKWVGESEKAVRETFRKARQAAPCIIFLDEIDAIAPVRGTSAGDSGVTERVISQLLTEMDGIEDLNNVILIAATNRPDILDPALLRSGRFGRHVDVGMPDVDARRQIFQIHFKNHPMADDVSFDELAERSEGLTGADIAGIAQEATMIAIREAVMQTSLDDTDENKVNDIAICRTHVDQAFEKVTKETAKGKKSYQAAIEKGPVPGLYQ
jgi:transitional endoplasmic reticulum ATPase